jgi:pectate lyase/lysophospholipase L1-like esterase
MTDFQIRIARCLLPVLGSLLLASCASKDTAQPANLPDPARVTLAAGDGWAAHDGGTTGGAAARPEHVFTVRDRAGLVAALALGDQPKIIRVATRIDLSVDDTGRPMGFEEFRDPQFDPAAFLREYDPKTWGRKNPEGPLEEARKRSAQRQADRVLIRIPSNTTVVGIAPGAGFVHGSLMLAKVSNVILRHLHISDAYDHFPAWDPKDNASGEWNSEYDNISLRGATHVWIDHCTLDDGHRPDHLESSVYGRRVQHHDGLLDITRGSDLVTVSWNHFRKHEKGSLVGGSDNHTEDAGKLRVTFHHNFWDQVKERAPRVRYGQVHLYNNLHTGSSEPPQPFGYSIGIGYASRIYSEYNAWETSPNIPSSQLVRVLRGTVFHDHGSIHNTRPVQLPVAPLQGAGGTTPSPLVGWTPTLAQVTPDAQAAAVLVRQRAGAAPSGQAPAAPTAAPPAPSIEYPGWARTRGGGGGRILKVTHLGASGPGSLKDAIEQGGPRMVVFEVGGTIDMAGQPLDIRQPYLTIAGQTAPSPGITVVHAETNIHTHDVIIQHLRFRPGEFGRPKRGGGDQDGLSTHGGAHDVVIDQCSFSWATDENLSASGPRFKGATPSDWRKATSHRVTFSNNLIYEGLSHSVHEKGEHSKGSLIHDNATGILIHRNVYISNRERNALFKGGAQGAMVNNLIFNPGRRAAHYNLLANEWEAKPYQIGRLSLVGNVLRYGPDTEPGVAFFTLRGAGDVQLFMNDNLATDRNGTPVAATADHTAGKARMLALQQADLPAQLKVMDAAGVEAELVRHAGARPWDRDALDARVLADMQAGRGKIIDSETESPLGQLPPPPPSSRVFRAEDWNLDDMSPRAGWPSLGQAVQHPAKPTVLLIGDSTMASRTGYGTPLCRQLEPRVRCINLARGGRSTLSFRQEGLWDEALVEARRYPGPVTLLIQFGHNDQPGKPGRSTDLAKEFPANLTRYLAEARAAGAQPVLVTPLTRRSFKEERLDDHLAPWAAATRDVASRQSVPVIDLHRLSMQVVQNMGSVRADQLAMTPPGHADFDRTHLGARGACLFADLMSRELSAQLPGLALPRTQGQVCEQLAGQTPVMN